jgi:hypothetical protein
MMVIHIQCILLRESQMQKHEGFFLIELLTYLSVFSFFIVLFMRLFAFTAYQLSIENKDAYVMAQLYATEQLMHRELEKVPIEQSKWCCWRDDEIIWQQGDKEVGWSFENNALVRKEGTYNNEQQQWRRKKTIIGVKYIQDGHFKLAWSHDDEIEPQLKLISTIIKMNDKSVDLRFHVSPRNRAYYGKK